MKILVCLKQVPHKDARLELASDGKWIQDANIKFEINDYDNYALEEALRVKDKDPATEVVVVCIGPDRVQQSLRTALGMGADRAVQIWDAELVGSDSLASAKAIAAVAKSEKPDLVLMGLMSDDTNYALTGPMLAQLLGVPHATGIVSAKLDGGQVEVERELDGGALEVVKLALPCLLTAQTGMNEVRYASLKGIMQAKKKPLDKKALGDLGLDKGAVAPKAKIEKIYTPPKGQGAEILSGSKDEVAQKFVGKVKELGLL